jgi:hypothetical protein
MKRNFFLLAAISFIFCLVSPLLAEGKDPKKAAKIKTDIAEQNMKIGAGADTFWTGLVIGAVGAAVLVPVSFLFEDKEGKEMKVVLIAGAGAGLTSLICMVWGGIDWIFGTGKLDELKKEEKDLTLAPYIYPLEQRGVEIGLGLNICL